jgi:uncharacterized membrane protein YccC
LALVSAVLFWPIWEGEKFTALLAAAVRANRVYLESIIAFVNKTDPNIDLLMTKRRAENANRYASASLQRMLTEPRARPETAERGAALTTYNQRMTRAFTAIVAGLQNPGPVHEAGVAAEAREISATLATLARAIEEEGAGPAAAELGTHLSALESLLSHTPTPLLTAGGTLLVSQLIWTHLAKCIVEIRAMTLVLGQHSDASR